MAISIRPGLIFPDYGTISESSNGKHSNYSLLHVFYSAEPAVASAGAAPSRDARTATVIEPQQCFKEVMASCLPREGDSASVGGVGAVSGFRPAWRDVGTKPGFVAWSAGDGGVGDFDGSRAVWRHAGHQLGFGACSGWELAARCCSSRGWVPIIFGGNLRLLWYR